MAATWFYETVFYHIYPLGLCGAPAQNDLSTAASTRLDKLFPWLEHLEAMGVSALYLGPVFESSTHGYDTADYYRVDRRLGDNALLERFVACAHQKGIRVILDAVFNHVGRAFWAFGDVRAQQQGSAYRAWFSGLDFHCRNGQGDPFAYDCWNGHEDLVKLNLANPAVREHLFGAVEEWIKSLGIDGLRLDAADCVDLDFQQALARFCRQLRPDFALLGEVIHGDYRRWANPETLDSVTNYELYKGLYSSHNDSNYFELAHSLKRQFGSDGLYRGVPLYTFADNHDVNRVASTLTQTAHLYPLYALLFTVPGVPSIYYGSEWGASGVKAGSSDAPLRPELELCRSQPHPDLQPVIARLAWLRRTHPALQRGSYRELLVRHEQLAFARDLEEERLIVAVNAAREQVALELNLGADLNGRLEDLLNSGQSFAVHDGHCTLPLDPCWARILVLRQT